jgi:hypothetical protein
MFLISANEAKMPQTPDEQQAVAPTRYGAVEIRLLNR